TGRRLRSRYRLCAPRPARQLQPRARRRPGAGPLRRRRARRVTVALDSHALEAADGHRWQLHACVPDKPDAALLWLPALGVGARHYLPFAQTLAARGVATFLHEWRGAGSSSLRAGHDCDWGYRELLELDIAASAEAMRRNLPGLPTVVGGHSLGGQLACCYLALAPEAASRIWLV